MPKPVRVNIRSVANTRAVRREKRNGRDVVIVPSGAFGFAPFQLAVYGLSDEVGALLFLGKHGVDPRKRPLREPRRHLLVIDLLPAHLVWAT